MATYRVLYARREHMRETLIHPEWVNHGSIPKTHVVVALQYASAPDAVFHAMQGEAMAPEMAQRVGSSAGRTSMSVGDVLFCVERQHPPPHLQPRRVDLARPHGTHLPHPPHCKTPPPHPDEPKP